MPNSRDSLNDGAKHRRVTRQSPSLIAYLSLQHADIDDIVELITIPGYQFYVPPPDSLSRTYLFVVLCAWTLTSSGHTGPRLESFTTTSRYPSCPPASMEPPPISSPHP